MPVLEEQRETESEASELAPSEAGQSVSPSEYEPSKRRRANKQKGKKKQLEPLESFADRSAAGQYFVDAMDMCFAFARRVPLLLRDLTGPRSALAGYGFLVAGFAGLCALYGAKSSMSLTMASWILAFGLSCLAIRVHKQKSVRGLSGQSIESLCWFFLVRLIPITIRQGYVPVDESGDYIYQLGDACCLVLALHLLYCLRKTYKDTFEHEKGAVGLPKNRLLLAFAAASVNHADLNNSWLYDVLWMASTYAEAFVLQPQVEMVKAGPAAGADALSSHYVLAVLVSRCLVFSFWWSGYSQLQHRDAAADEINWAGLGVIFSVALQVLHGSELLYYFVTETLQGPAVTKAD